jgi:hypothetical protein
MMMIELAKAVIQNMAMQNWGTGIAPLASRADTAS